MVVKKIIVGRPIADWFAKVGRAPKSGTSPPPRSRATIRRRTDRIASAMLLSIQIESSISLRGEFVKYSESESFRTARLFVMSECQVWRILRHRFENTVIISKRVCVRRGTSLAI